jgi:hypothetical protein
VAITVREGKKGMLKISMVGRQRELGLWQTAHRLHAPGDDENAVPRPIIASRCDGHHSATSTVRKPERRMYFSDEQERTMRNQETTITILSDSISSQSKTETTNTHIELSEEELDKITGGGGPPTTVRD